ncbi:MAG TPA: M23 family metallopeptidase [Candidatus Paceibacterota bacterium]
MRKFFRLTVIAIGCLFFADSSWAQAKSFEILNKSVEQGDVVIVNIFSEWQDPTVCVFVFEKQYVPNKFGYVFIGVDVNTEPTGTPEKTEKYLVYLVECGRGVRLDWYYDELEVREKEFGIPWYVGPVRTPGKAVQERRIKDVALMNKAYSLANKDENYASGEFVMPLKNIEVTDLFGTLRLYGRYNRKSKKITVDREVPHGGVDFRAKTPLPVMAVNSGKVLLTHYFPLRGTEGNLLVIDHGSGILSLYMHLSRFRVKAGDWVERGQVVALTGDTPKGVTYRRGKPVRWNTPAHLHFMFKIHGVNVDPLAFIEIANKYRDKR